jgi:branched-chain amino acid aminotransferase
MERAFLYGDLLFETMLAEGGSVALISQHYSRLANAAAVLKMDLCGLNEEKFNTQSLQALQNFNPTPKKGEKHRIRYTLYRESKGTYLPDSNQSNFNISISRFEPKNAAEIHQLGIYPDQQKAPGKLSNLKSGNALIYVMASIWAKENNLDGALICNTNGYIIESDNSNIFWRKNGVWFSPPLTDGCIAGIGRELFIASHQVTEKSCTETDLLNADECILTNALYLKRNFKFTTHNS